MLDERGSIVSVFANADELLAQRCAGRSRTSMAIAAGADTWSPSSLRTYLWFSAELESRDRTACDGPTSLSPCLLAPVVLPAAPFGSTLGTMPFPHSAARLPHGPSPYDRVQSPQRNSSRGELGAAIAIGLLQNLLNR